VSLASVPLPDLPEATDRRVAFAVVGFVRALRAAGLEVPVGSTVTFVQALAQVGLEREPAVYWAGRATLLRRHEDLSLYDAVFTSWWHGVPFEERPAGEPETITLAMDDDDAEPDSGDGDEADQPTITVRYSASETLHQKDFSECTDAELAELYELMAKLRFGGETRRARRRVPSRRSSGRPDLRRTVRHALRAGGEPVHRAFTEPGERPRRLVLLLDVSGSMEAYARALVRFVHAAVVGRGKVEVFTIGTRLTRITRELQSRDPDAALTRAGSAVGDWSGGTRLGDCIGQFNDDWGQRGMARGAVVVILSDGWDRGDPAVMAEQMGRLHRVAHRVIWVNPLKASPGYAPLAQGMAAALPYIDDFVEGHALDSIARLADLLSGAPR
jgi:uncharacterized protein with von Willebrand factor type A (vWA) domain